QFITARPRQEKRADDWELLASTDPAVSQPAIVKLATNAKQAIGLFREKLPPTVAIPPARIGLWIDDLDSDQFERRLAAERALAGARDQAEEQLRQAVKKPGSLELRRRAERVLKQIDPSTDPVRLRQMRVVEILERLGTKEAIELLRRLARGAPAAELTREA